MIFGRIDYLNLLPFYLFLKRYHNHLLRLSTAKKGPPSAINRLFKTRRIDAGFISSIKSRGQRGANLGIIARGPVTSVLVIEGEFTKDPESDTSNALAKLLGLQGRVAIGDKALKLYCEGAKAVDLAERWQQQTGMPFVFARLCYNNRGRRIKRLEKQFLRRMTRRIPQTVLKQKAAQSGINPEAIVAYLQRIDYRLDRKAERGLKKFLFLTRHLNA